MPMPSFASEEKSFFVRTPRGVKEFDVSSSWTPARPDGMTCIPWGNDYMLLRNHEIDGNEGGVTAAILDKNLSLKDEYWAQTGSSRNCSGGKTIWDTWLTCEENFDKFEKRHGYVFEVDPHKSVEENSVPITEMGRFNHEACGHHEASGFVYMTEDRKDSSFYRFIPNDKRNLRAGGTLEALVIEGRPGVNTGNFKEGEKVRCSWIKVDDHDPEEDVLRTRVQEKGAAIFVRGEGITVSGDDIIFTCTTGGENGLGQIFSYHHATGILEVLYQPTSKKFLKQPDNLCFNHLGDLLVCEDGGFTNRIVGITPDKKVYLIAESRFGEWAGVCMSPDNRFVFANLQSLNKTYAFEVDWNKIRI